MRQIDTLSKVQQTITKLQSYNWCPCGSMGAVVSLFLTLMLFNGGCGRTATLLFGPEIQPLRFEPVPWQDGERSEYHVIDRNEEFAGTARFELIGGRDGAGSELWNLRRDITAQGDQEIVDVLLNAQTLRPQSSILVRKDRQGQQSVTTTYQSGQADIELTTRRDITTYERMNVPSDVRDRRTLVMLARALPLEQGYASRLNSFLPVAGLLDRVELQVMNQENVVVDAGSFEAWRIRLNSQNSQIIAWVAVEPPHQLLKFTDSRNEATFELVSYQSESVDHNR